MRIILQPYQVISATKITGVPEHKLRRDSKGRVLRTSESQRPDERYAYKYNDGKTRKALTGKHERACLAFVKQDKYYCRYYDDIYVLFHTGLRISKFVGLTVADVDPEEAGNHG